MLSLLYSAYETVETNELLFGVFCSLGEKFLLPVLLDKILHPRQSDLIGDEQEVRYFIITQVSFDIPSHCYSS